MEIDKLIGQQIYVRTSELFSVPTYAVIRAVDMDSKALLLEFTSPVHIGTQTYVVAVAYPRLQRDDLNVLLSTGVIGCAVTCVPCDRFDSLKPFDLSWWRGGGAVIAGGT